MILPCAYANNFADYLPLEDGPDEFSFLDGIFEKDNDPPSSESEDEDSSSEYSDEDLGDESYYDDDEYDDDEDLEHSTIPGNEYNNTKSGDVVKHVNGRMMINDDAFKFKPAYYEEVDPSLSFGSVADDKYYPRCDIVDGKFVMITKPEGCFELTLAPVVQQEKIDEFVLDDDDIHTYIKIENGYDMNTKLPFDVHSFSDYDMNTDFSNIQCFSNHDPYYFLFRHQTFAVGENYVLFDNGGMFMNDIQLMKLLFSMKLIDKIKFYKMNSHILGKFYTHTSRYADEDSKFIKMIMMMESLTIGDYLCRNFYRTQKFDMFMDTTSRCFKYMKYNGTRCTADVGRKLLLHHFKNDETFYSDWVPGAYNELRTVRESWIRDKIKELIKYTAVLPKTRTKLKITHFNAIGLQ